MKLFLFFLLSFYSGLYAASATKEYVLSNYIYNFALYTSWPDGIEDDQFNIYLLSSNKKLSSSLKALVKGQKLHGKEIEVTRSSTLTVPYSAKLVYVDTKYLNDYKKIYDQVDGRSVLLVTQGYDNKRLVMLNIKKDDDKKIIFEVNRANIINQGLSISPKVILLGGTELDVAKLYKGAKDSLLQKEKELQKRLHEAQTLKKEIQEGKQRNSIIKKKYLLLQKHIEDLDKKALVSEQNFQKQLEQQKTILANEKASTQTIRDDYAKANAHLDEMSAKLGIQKEKLSTQELKVQEKESKLSTLTQKIRQKAIEFNKLQKELTSQGVQIEDQSQTIDAQQDVLLLLTAFASVFLALVVIIFKTLRRENKTNEALTQSQLDLEEQVKKTEKANASKTKFLAHMSHELRTPLNAVLGYSQLLQKDTHMTDENKQLLGTINRSGEHLLSLINDVLEVSKIETGHIEIDPISFDLYVFLDDIYSMFATQLSNKGLSIKLIKDTDLPQFIYADINKVRQIFINILGNSIKFTSHGGLTIRVGHNPTDSMLLVEIEDTGEGINQEEIDKLFQPFKQTISGKLGGGGAGLGLSIVQEYLNLMGGSIKVSSKPAFGTTFYLGIPFEKATASEVEDKQFQAVRSLKEENMGIEVLIADDNKENNDLLQKTLERVGFKVTTVENGLEALRVFKQMQQKLVLLDIEMPVMDGHKAAKAIRSLEYAKQTPIFAVTASVFGIDQDKASGSGFTTLIRKPFKDYELFYEIGKALDIEYIYEENNGTKISTVSLSDLNEDLKQNLLQAVSDMNISTINKLISQSESDFKDEANYMKKLAQRFDYETLIQELNK